MDESTALELSKSWETGSIPFGGATSRRRAMLYWLVSSIVHQQRAENGEMPKQGGVTRNRALPRTSGHHLPQHQSSPSPRKEVRHMRSIRPRGVEMPPTGMPHVRRERTLCRYLPVICAAGNRRRRRLSPRCECSGRRRLRLWANRSSGNNGL